MSDSSTDRELAPAASLCAVFQDVVRTKPNELALSSSDGQVRLTWREYGERVRKVAAGLAAVGVRPGDTVALMMSNRPEFFLVDLAVIHLGATPFSIYNTSSAEQIRYLLTTAGTRVVVCEEQFLERIRTVGAATGVDRVVTVDPSSDGTMSLADLEAAGDPTFDVDAAWQAVESGDVLTLIFTSGTTGPPKAVELTHANILETCGVFKEYREMLGADAPDATVLSYLPDAHLANRLFGYYLPTTTGASIVTVRDGKTVGAVLGQVHPTMFVGVPMIWYRLKTAVEQVVAAQVGEAAEQMRQALETGMEKVRHEAAGTPLPEELRLRYAEADRLVLSALRAKLGFDRLVAGISGGAPISAEALQFLMSVGIPVVEGWAMSETSGAGLLNPPDRIKAGTVGLPTIGTEIALGADGELLVRGPGVMKGYRGDPEKTADAVDADGWLHTGDVATVDEDGYVTIVDRKKELIITTGGKNMSPAHIENAVKIAGPLVGSVVAIGDGRPYVVALVTLEPDAVASFAAAHGLTDVSPGAMSQNPIVQAAVWAGVEKANETLSRVEQVRDVLILPTYWLPDSEVLTPTMKLKRKVIDRKYAAEIEEVYSRQAARKAVPAS